MPVISQIAGLHQEMTKWRHDLHANPELGLQETRTSAVVQAKLRSFGVDEIITGLARTGVVGVIHGRGRSRRAIGLRADMDALPIHELTGLPYASQNDGVMHACGHDGHTTMLLGAARYLAETRNFNGTVYAIFQPAEEGLGGGAMMVKEGLFERCPMEMVFGIHNWPRLPAGTFAWRSGPIRPSWISRRVHRVPTPWRRSEWNTTRSTRRSHRTFWHGPRLVWGLSSRTEDDRLWVVSANSDTRPAVNYIYDRSAQTSRGILRSVWPYGACTRDASPPR